MLARQELGRARADSSLSGAGGSFERSGSERLRGRCFR
jgi:hypothetical protein